LHAASQKYWEQLSGKCNRVKAKNSITDSVAEFWWILKGIKTFKKNSDKFSKIHSWLDLDKSEFSRVHLYVRFWVTKQASNGLVWIKEKSFNLKFKPYNIWYIT
jgi:hypothetical protein